MSRRKVGIAIGAGTIAVFALIYATFEPFRAQVQGVAKALVSVDVQELKDYLLGFGPWAPFVSGLLMILQALFAPIPSSAITVVNGALFGTVWGAALSWSSAMVGAVLCYWLSRRFGRPLAEKLVGAESLASAERFFERYGGQAILLARLIPVVSFDVVSYAAGLTSISLGRFALATGLGQLPATIVYSMLGQYITRAARISLWVVFGVATLVTIGLIFKGRREKRAT